MKKVGIFALLLTLFGALPQLRAQKADFVATIQGTTDSMVLVDGALVPRRTVQATFPGGVIAYNCYGNLSPCSYINGIEIRVTGTFVTNPVDAVTASGSVRTSENTLNSVSAFQAWPCTYPGTNCAHQNSFQLQGQLLAVEEERSALAPPGGDNWIFPRKATLLVASGGQNHKVICPDSLVSACLALRENRSVTVEGSFSGYSIGGNFIPEIVLVAASARQ